MGRRKLADPRKIVLGVKVTKGKAEAVDTARGDLKPAQWLEKLIDAALEAEGISSAPLDSLPPRIPVVKTARPRTRARKAPDPLGPPQEVLDKMAARGMRELTERVPSPPPGAAVFQDPGAERVVTDAPPAPAATRKRCTHRGYRQIGGYCHDCDHLIETGGYWRELAGPMASIPPGSPGGDGSRSRSSG